MRILLINHYAGSRTHGMEYRPFYMAREWTKLGHEITIVAASRSHVRTRAPVFAGPYGEEVVEGIRYIWLRTPSYQGNGARRALNIFAFVWQLLRREAWLAQHCRPDVVIASSTYPLDNWPASRLAKRCGAWMVYEVHDLWPLSPIELAGMSPRHPFIVVMQWAENLGCRKADRVVSLLPGAAGHLEEHGMATSKFVHVPNGVSQATWEADRNSIPEEHEAAISRLKATGQFIVGYAGSHGLANALDSLLDSTHLLRGENVTFVLVGHGPLKRDLQARAERERFSNVVFLPPVAKAAIPALLNCFDVCYIGLKRTSLFRFGVSPNKLLDYMMAGKPIIQAIDAGNDIVKESGSGLTVASEDPGQIAHAIRHLKSLTSEQRDRMGQGGREYVLKNHDYPVLATRFLDALGRGGTFAKHEYRS